MKFVTQTQHDFETRLAFRDTSSWKTCWRWLWTISNCPLSGCVDSRQRDKDVWVVFWGRLPQWHAHWLCSAPSLPWYIWRRDDTVGQKWHRPQRAVFFFACRQLWSTVCVLLFFFLRVLMCAVSRYVRLWSVSSQRSILRVADISVNRVRSAEGLF